MLHRASVRETMLRVRECPREKCSACANREKIIKAKLQHFAQVRILGDWKLSIEDFLPPRTRSEKVGREDG